MVNDLFVFERIRKGDVAAFEALFRHYHTPLCLYAAAITGRQEVAEEIVQDLFYVCWKDREKLQIRSIRSYLYGSVRNRSLQYCEHRAVVSRHRETVLAQTDGERQTADPQEVLEYRELENLIDRTLRKLPERRLRIFRMHRVEGKKYVEIAEALALSVKTVEAEMTKALQTLRKEIEKYIDR
jgi:RNA polymerase sigma-70 factor (ECF subfamily)